MVVEMEEGKCCCFLSQVLAKVHISNAGRHRFL